jgi:hypothetical protein
MGGPRANKSEEHESTIIPELYRRSAWILAVSSAESVTESILGRDKATALHDLLPLTEWPEPLTR